MHLGTATIDVPRAAAAIRAAAVNLSEHAPSIVDDPDMWRTRLDPPTLMPLSTAQAHAAAALLRPAMRWVDDGNCYARGMIGAALVDAQLGSGIRDTTSPLHMAVATLPTNMRVTGWSFHAAPTYVDGVSGEQRVIDFVLGDRLGRPSGDLSSDEWARGAGQRSEDVSTQHPLDNVPLDGGPLRRIATPHVIRELGESLVTSLDRSERPT